jgi:hypothetical protein
MMTTATPIIHFLLSPTSVTGVMFSKTSGSWPVLTGGVGRGGGAGGGETLASLTSRVINKSPFLPPNNPGFPFPLSLRVKPDLKLSGTLSGKLVFPAYALNLRSPVTVTLIILEESIFAKSMLLLMRISSPSRGGYFEDALIFASCFISSKSAKGSSSTSSGPPSSKSNSFPSRTAAAHFVIKALIRDSSSCAISSTTPRSGWCARLNCLCFFRASAKGVVLSIPKISKGWRPPLAEVIYSMSVYANFS